MVTAVQSLMSGGKRLRPAFAYWGWLAAGGQDSDAAVRASTSLEFLQACALIHDDVMDGSDTRRGKPAVHRFFEAVHGAEQWNGSAAGFGMGAAILAGDLCLSWADELLYTSGLPLDSLMRAKPVYDNMRTELMAGQYLDVLEQARASADVSTILNVVKHKSAKYTIERPLHMGAVLAGAGDAVIRTLSDYGLPLGEAFQLRDDVLGVFGSPEVTGKPAGDDLREGKRTVLIAFTYELASAADLELFDLRLGQADITPQEISAMQRIITSSGALQKVEDLIVQGREAALTAAQSPLITAHAQQALAALAVACTERVA